MQLDESGIWLLGNQLPQMFQVDAWSEQEHAWRPGDPIVPASKASASGSHRLFPAAPAVQVPSPSRQRSDGYFDNVEAE